MTPLGAPTPPASPEQSMNVKNSINGRSHVPSSGPLPPFSSCLPSSSLSGNVYSMYSQCCSQASQVTSAEVPVGVKADQMTLTRGMGDRNKSRPVRKRNSGTFKSNSTSSSSAAAHCTCVSSSPVNNKCTCSYSSSRRSNRSSCDTESSSSPGDLQKYKVDGSKKPPFSYATLIAMAIRDNDNKMTLSSIYEWIRDNFLYYRNADPSWQVRIHQFFLLFFLPRLFFSSSSPRSPRHFHDEPFCLLSPYYSRLELSRQ